MKRLALILAALGLLASAGAAHAATFELHVPVLMYHRIECAPPDARYPSLWICPSLFDEHMAAIEAAGWHTITADELAADLWAGRCPAPRSLVISIDDGGLDGYTNGAPILEAHGLRGTFYMVAGRAGDYLTQSGLAKEHFSWDQARDLVARGHGIGNHTLTHASLGTVNEAKLERQVGEAQALFEDQLGFGPRTFAWPRGLTSEQAATYLSAHGFELAFTEVPGTLESTATPMYAQRMRVKGYATAATVAQRLENRLVACS